MPGGKERKRDRAKKEKAMILEEEKVKEIQI